MGKIGCVQNEPPGRVIEGMTIGVQLAPRRGALLTGIYRHAKRAGSRIVHGTLGRCSELITAGTVSVGTRIGLAEASVSGLNSVTRTLTRYNYFNTFSFLYQIRDRIAGVMRCRRRQ